MSLTDKYDHAILLLQQAKKASEAQEPLTAIGTLTCAVLDIDDIIDDEQDAANLLGGQN